MQTKSIKCAYCIRKLSTSCVTCTNCSSIRLCINCFLSGAESGAHKKSHAYTFESLRIGAPDGLFISQGDWTSEEERRLLDAVETYGYGNWIEVSTQLPARTATECQYHYEQFYVYGTIGKATIGKNESKRGVTIDDTSSSLEIPMFPVCDLRPDEYKVVGYVPLRDEFEYVYNNDAEKILVSVPYGLADELETELQLALVSIYNKHLAERCFRHKIAREHGLIPLLVRSLIEPNFHGKPHRYCSTNRARSRGNRVNRRRKSRFFFTSRKIHRALTRSTITHFRRRVKRLSNVPEQPQFDDPSTLDRSVTCDHVHSNRSPINTSYCASCSDSGIVQVPPALSPNEPCTAAQRITAQQNLLFDSERPQPDNPLTSTELMGARLGLHKKPEQMSSTFSKSSASGLCSAFSRCLGMPTLTVSDSGIGSCDSCAQSTISCGSTNGDPFAYASSSGTPSARLPLSRRPRSNSDSIYVSSSLFPGRKRSPVLLANLMELRHQSESTPSIVQPVEPPSWMTEEKHSVAINAAAQTTGSRGEVASKTTIKRRRGRPSRKHFKSRSRFSSRKTTYDTHPTWMKPFLRFMSQQEARKFFANLERESVLRSELEQLRDHHRKGARSMANIELQPSIRPNPVCELSLNGNAFQQRSSAAKAGSRQGPSSSRRRKSHVGRPLKRVSGKRNITPRPSRLSLNTSEPPSVRKRGRPPKHSLGKCES